MTKVRLILFAPLCLYFVYGYRKNEQNKSLWNENYRQKSIIIIIIIIIMSTVFSHIKSQIYYMQAYLEPRVAQKTKITTRLPIPVWEANFYWYSEQLLI
jgi:heme/copper-type cytochrome/quinol oxidase subunit 2